MPQVMGFWLSRPTLALGARMWQYVLLRVESQVAQNNRPLHPKVAYYVLCGLWGLYVGFQDECESFVYDVATKTCDLQASLGLR